MAESRPELATALRRVMRDVGNAGDHPEPAELLELAMGETTEERAAELREHLVHCSDCTRRYLAMSELPEEVPADFLDEETVESHLRKLETTVEEKGPAGDRQGRSAPAEFLGAPRGRQDSEAWWSGGALLAVAAALLVGVLGFWLGSSPNMGGEALRVASVAQLVPEDLASRSAEGSVIRLCPEDGAEPRSLVLMMPILEETLESTYAISLRSPEGRTFTLHDVPVDPDGVVSVQVSTGDLEEGSYVVQVVGSSGAIHRYPVRFVCSTSS